MRCIALPCVIADCHKHNAVVNEASDRMTSSVNYLASIFPDVSAQCAFHLVDKRVTWDVLGVQPRCTTSALLNGQASSQLLRLRLRARGQQVLPGLQLLAWLHERMSYRRRLSFALFGHKPCRAWTSPLYCTSSAGFLACSLSATSAVIPALHLIIEQPPLTTAILLVLLDTMLVT